MKRDEIVTPNISDKEKKITINSTFSCVSCGRGGEKYSEVFSEGKCDGCGAPVESFYATITEIGKEKLQRMVLLLSAEDIGQKLEEIISELKQNGIGVINGRDIIDGSQIATAATNLSFVARNTIFTLVISSEGIKKDPIVEAVVSDAYFNSEEKEIILVPIVFDQAGFNNLPFGLRTKVGCNWSSESNEKMRFLVSKEELFKDINRRQIDQNESES